MLGKLVQESCRALKGMGAGKDRVSLYSLRIRREAVLATRAKAVSIPQACSRCSAAPPLGILLWPSDLHGPATKSCLLHDHGRVLSQILILLVYFAVRILMFIK